MKKKILTFILFFICSFCLITNVKAKAYSDYDTGTCIDDFGTITFLSQGDDNFPGGSVSFENKNNTASWSTNAVTFDVNVKAVVSHKIKTIHYSIISKEGYSCSGVISGDKWKGNQGNVKLHVEINKGWVNEMAFWGKTVKRDDPNVHDVTKSDIVNVKREMTDKELEELGEDFNLTTGESLNCKTIDDLLGKYWTWVLILAPIVAMILITLDFVKALIASDSDALKKAGNNTFKRTIALVLLLLLPVLAGFIFGLFGIETCF